jgi:hypothetical protein
MVFFIEINACTYPKSSLITTDLIWHVPFFDFGDSILFRYRQKSLIQIPNNWYFSGKFLLKYWVKKSCNSFYRWVAFC